MESEKERKFLKQCKICGLKIESANKTQCNYNFHLHYEACKKKLKKRDEKKKCLKKESKTKKTLTKSEALKQIREDLPVEADNKN